jgi:hypothetical protein
VSGPGLFAVFAGIFDEDGFGRSLRLVKTCPSRARAALDPTRGAMHKIIKGSFQRKLESFLPPDVPVQVIEMKPELRTVPD